MSGPVCVGFALCSELQVKTRQSQQENKSVIVLAVLCRPCTLQAEPLLCICIYLFIDAVWLVVTDHKDRAGLI